MSPILATGKTRSLGLVLPYADAFLDQNPFCNQVMHGVMREAVHRHYNLMMYTAAGGLDKDDAGSLLDCRVDGMLLVMPAAKSRTIERLVARGIPHVSVLREQVDGGWIVNSDDEEGGRLAARHLVSLGHNRIAHLAGTADIASSAPRAKGFCEELEKAGRPLAPRLMMEAGFSFASGYAAMRKLLSRTRAEIPTAVFAANDLCADGAMRAIREFGLNVPNDIAVVGYDDTWFAGMTHPPLTSVHMPIAEMGETAAAMLIDRLEGKELAVSQPTLPVSLTIRSSCGTSVAGYLGDEDVSPIASMRK
jgi:DNA-binding LacI/PurR family transcriptional regulator